MAASTVDLTRGPALLSVSVITASFSISASVARLCVRRRTGDAIGLDDYAIGVGIVVAFIGTIFSIVEGTSMSSSAKALEFDFLGQPWFMMGATMAKIAICLSFIRLVGSVRHWRVLLAVQIFLMAIVNLAFSMAVNFQCRPLEKLWNMKAEGICWDRKVQQNIGYVQGAFSVFWWFFLSLFPVIVARHLDMYRVVKWPFYVMSSLSLVVGIFATVRTSEISKLNEPGVYTFDTFCATLLAILEQNIGLVAANMLPLARLLLQRRRTEHEEDTSSLNRVSDVSSRGKWLSRNNSITSLKRGSVLMMDGSTFSNSGLKEGHYGFTNRSSDDSSRWPRGIIKTVEVEVIEEVITDIEAGPGHRASVASSIVVEQDWEMMLRSGPSPLPTKDHTQQIS